MVAPVYQHLVNTPTGWSILTDFDNRRVLLTADEKCDMAAVSFIWGSRGYKTWHLYIYFAIFVCVCVSTILCFTCVYEGYLMLCY